MPRFFASTARGLQDSLQRELVELGFHPSKEAGGFVFESNWAGCYRANLRLRTASRVLWSVLDFPAYQPDELYHNVLKHDFTRIIEPHQSIAVEASVRESHHWRDQRFVALKVKDAIVDQFREKFGKRPDVDKDNPDLKIFVRCVKSQFSISIDTSGESLHKRGYRAGESVEAPLREHVAAGLLDLADWPMNIPIVDPFCGSGTILIEAALKMKKVAPGTLRKGFAFQRLKNFQPEAFDSEVNQALEDEIEAPPIKLYGYDIDGKAIRLARKNAEAAEVADLITFEREPVSNVKAPAEQGMVITNPPYGHRIGDPYALGDTYKDFAHTLKSEFRGWPIWILAGNKELTPSLRMKAERKFPVYNGNLECRFLNYHVFKGAP